MHFITFKLFIAYILPRFILYSSGFLADTTTPQTQSCNNLTFLDHGQNTKAKSFYNILQGHNASSCELSCKSDNLCRTFRISDETCKLSVSDLISRIVTLEECQEDCVNDETCYGYLYDDCTQKCALSNVRIHGEDPTCNSCHFHEKKCQSGRHNIMSFYFNPQVLTGICTP